MRLNGLTSANQAVVTDYIAVFRPLKAATKRLEGRGASSAYRAVAKVILVFKYILKEYKDQVTPYAAVDYNAYNKAPKDYIAINLKAAQAKLNDYYNKLNDSPAYYAATILHPRYKKFCDVVQANKPAQLYSNNRAFNGLWA